MRKQESSRCAIALLGLLSVAVCVEVQAQIPMERTHSIEGPFQGIGNGGVIITRNGTPTLLKVGPDTEIRLRAPGSEDFLTPGLAIQVEGKLDPQTGVISAADVIVYANSGGPIATTNRGATYSYAMAPTDTKIPLMLIGQIVGTNPLQVKGGPNFRTSYSIKGPTGNSVRELPTTNKVFAVEANAKDIRVDFLKGLQLARPGDSTWAWVGNTSQIAHEIIIRRGEQIEMQELGIEDSKGLMEGGKKPKAKSVAKKKSSKSENKSDDDSKDEEPVKAKKTKPSAKKPADDEGDEQNKPAKKKPIPRFEEE